MSESATWDPATQEPSQAAPLAVPKLGDRALLPQLGARAYLNHAAISPTTALVQQAVQTVLNSYAVEGAGAFARWVAQRETLRGDLACLVNANVDEIALGFNTSRGVNDIALCLPWKKGDRVLVFSGEFPTNVTPWQRAAELFGLEICYHVSDDFFTDVGLERLQTELRRGLRLVAVSAVQFQTGLCMPLAEMGRLCHEHGAELFVDGIQACGAVPIDVRAQNIDYLVSGSHKWLMGMEGTGFVFAAREKARALRPNVAAWLSHEEPLGFLFEDEGKLRYDRAIRTDVSFLEGGTVNSMGFAALAASLRALLELGVHNIFCHVNRYIDALERELLSLGFVSLRAVGDRRSTILSVEPPAGVSAVSCAASMRQQGVVCGTPDGKLRFAPHYHNHLDEIALVASAAKQSLSGK